MQCACQQADLSRALTIVNRAVSSKPTLPILSNVLITAQSGRLILTGYDLEIGIRTEVPIQGDLAKSQRSVAVPAKMMQDMVNTVGEGELTLDLTENHDLVISSSRGQFTLRGAPGEDYPDFPSFETGEAAKESKSFEIVAKELLGGLKRTIFATAREASRAFTSGVHFETEEDLLVLVATDGRRLALDKVVLAGRDGLKKKEHTALLPARNMDDLVSILPLVCSEDDTITFAFTSRLARVSAGSAEVILHLLDAQFPDYQKVIPQSFKGRIELSREDLNKAIRQVAIVARQKEGRDMAILSTDGDRLTISARVDSVGSARTELATSKEGDEMKVAFNYQYLQDAISAIDAETIELKYAGQVDPGVMHLPAHPHYTYVLMPVRLMD